MRSLRFGALAVAIAVLPWPVSAQELRIGTASDPTSLDPQFTNAAPNIALTRQIFDGLINYGPKLELMPGLAKSWAQVDALTWRIELRQGVTFHDGTPFTSADVLCSMTRALDMPNSPSSFASTLRGKTFAADGDFGVVITTAAPNPLMADDLAPIAIVSHEVGCGASTAEFNSGANVIGTGPFAFVSRTPDRIVLSRNDSYWGERPAWEAVSILPITQSGPRVAALLSGSVDLIDAVPNADIARLHADPRFTLFRGPTTRVIHVVLDQARENSPFVHSADGGPIANPLRNPKVRLALSMAIDRYAIRDRIMEGNAIPAGQLQPEGIFGHVPSLEPITFDPDRARQLLAEAGYPNGFRLTVHGPNDRYQNDDAIVRAIGSMWSQIGIDTDVETMPWALYNPRQADGGDGQPGFSASLSGVASLSSGGLTLLRLLIASYDTQRGFGNFNRGRYSSPTVDEMVTEALQTFDERRRAEITREATKFAMEDVAIIPIHFQVATWAARNNIDFTPQMSEFTFAAAARPR